MKQQNSKLEQNNKDWCEITRLKDYLNSNQNNIKCVVNDIRVTNDIAEIDISPVSFNITKTIYMNAQVSTDNKSNFEKLLESKEVVDYNFKNEIIGSIVNVNMKIISNNIVVSNIEGIHTNKNEDVDQQNQNYNVFQLFGLSLFISISGFLLCIAMMLLMYASISFFIYLILNYPIFIPILYL